MTARRAGSGGTHGSRPTGCGGHPGRTEASVPTTGRRGRRPLHTLSLRGAKRRGNPFSPAQRDGFPRQCVPQGHLLRGAHWRGMTAQRAVGTAGHMGPALRGAAVIQGGQGRPPLQSRTRTVRNGTSRTPSPTKSQGVCAMGGQRRPPLQSRTRTVRNGTAGTACHTNRRGTARTAKFRNFFFPLSASAGLRRLYSDDTGRPPVL